MGIIRSIIRFKLFLLIVLAYISYYLLISLFKGRSLDRVLALRKKCVRDVTKALGVVIDSKNIPSPLTKPAIVVSNHRSYADALPVLVDITVIPLAKMEVKKWPFLGFAATLSGIMYVQREQKASRQQARSSIRETLHNGYNVLVYPEGTTHDQDTTIEIRRGVFDIAAQEGLPILPMVVEYKDKTDAWSTDESFVSHFLKCFAKPKTYMKVKYGEPIEMQDAEAMRLKVKHWMDEELLTMQKEW